MYQEPSSLELVKLSNEIKQLFPTANPAVIDVIVGALRTHAQKQNDYSGNSELHASTGELGNFCDVWRKAVRLYTFYFVKDVTQVVPEHRAETAEDLLVYAAMLLATIKKEQQINRSGSISTEPLPVFTIKNI